MKHADFARSNCSLKLPSLLCEWTVANQFYTMKTVLVLVLVCALSVISAQPHNRIARKVSSSDVKFLENEIDIDPASQGLQELTRTKKSLKGKEEPVGKGVPTEVVNENEFNKDDGEEKEEVGSSQTSLTDVDAGVGQEIGSEKEDTEVERSRRQQAVIVSPMHLDGINTNLMMRAAPVHLDGMNTDLVMRSAPMQIDNTNSGLMMRSAPMQIDNMNPGLIMRSAPMQVDTTNSGLMMRSAPMLIENTNADVMMRSAPLGSDNQDLVMAPITPDSARTKPYYVEPVQQYQPVYQVMKPVHPLHLHPLLHHHKQLPLPQPCHCPCQTPCHSPCGRSADSLNEEKRETSSFFIDSPLRSSQDSNGFEDSKSEFERAASKVPSECTMESLSRLKMDKKTLEGLMNMEESKLTKIEDCGKKNLDTKDYANIVSLVDKEIELLQDQVKQLKDNKKKV